MRISFFTLQTKKILSNLLAATFVAATAFVATQQANGAPRSVNAFNSNWQFSKGTIETITDWTPVALPHCWNASDGTHKDYYRGPGTYVKHFDVEENLKKNRFFIRFEAASLKAELWLNGQRLGDHRGAFNAFIFELTPYLKARDNELRVVVDNTYDNDIAPLEGDFTVFGGIYRPAALIVTPRECITPMDMASSGVYVTPFNVSGTTASIAVDALVEAESKNLAIKTIVRDCDGNVKAESRTDVQTSKHGFKALTDTLTIDSPQLWHGLDNPALYSVEVKLLRNGKVIDSVTETTGFRTVDVDVTKGLSLNGKAHNIRGVNRHQDRINMGWGITNREHREDMELIKEIGANGVRLAHYPHSKYFYSLCDSAGMLVWAEIPFIGHFNDTPEFVENIELQLRELIRQNYNHPSIFCWSLFNELGGKDPAHIVKSLNDIAHEEDPTRYTVAAPNNDGRAENDITDLLAFNVYPGWYWAGPEVMCYAVDWKYKPEKNQPLAISEYGAGANIYQHAILEKAPKTDGHYHPEEWQAHCHEINYLELDKRPFLWGTFVWNMFDFASAGRNEGADPGMNDKGLVTYDRKHRKDAFYFYKANWNKREPMVHIASKRWAVRSGDSHDIKIYSNCNEVKLTVNGQQMPNVEPTLATFVWKNVTLKKGENVIEASAISNGQTITDSTIITIE